MTSTSNGRVRHRRSHLRRRAVIGGAAALGLTGAALVATSLMSTAGAATGWPEAKDEQPVSRTIEVSGTRDGGLKRYYGSGALGEDGQGEGQDPIFKLKDGATLKNVIIGAPAADGIHCQGSCTLQNVWWEDVGEDAATFKGTSAGSTYAVQGGGAKMAKDKVFQFNGAGKLVVNKFQVSDFGKLVRTCGNCSKQYQRHVVINDTDITGPGKSIVGINTNYGDTAALRAVRIHGDSSKKIKTCLRFTGNNTGAEPVETGSGPDGKHCKFTASDITYK
ncbi:pectate lyase [Streptomyces sp. BG9H]|uniref:Pectate lyase n=1 Tax=Streptomyces anatolicus TaxID=2675858 RepID=A0ABS6YH34_9ACTN|nr:pectate lyase [Streptomyces anatolicus]MBW5420721.1 pectate lyase [Streptomyces anatolicus]